MTHYIESVHEKALVPLGVSPRQVTVTSENYSVVMTVHYPAGYDLNSTAEELREAWPTMNNVPFKLTEFTLLITTGADIEKVVYECLVDDSDAPTFTA